MYEVFAHTADLGLRVRGADLGGLFAETGRAFLSVIVANPADVELRTSLDLEIAGDDPPYLLADWLNELLFIFESRRLLLCDFDVSISSDGLRARVQGETLDERRHELIHEIKAVTYHGLKVEQAGGQWTAEVILDI